MLNMMIKESNGKKFNMDNTDEELVMLLEQHSSYEQRLSGIGIIILYLNRRNKHNLDGLKPQIVTKITDARSVLGIFRKEASERELKYSIDIGDILGAAKKIMNRVNWMENYNVEIVLEKNKPRYFANISTKELINYYINMITFMVPALEMEGVNVMGWEESIILRAIYFVDLELKIRDVGYKFN